MNDLIIKNCPHCGNELYYDGVNIICTNADCPGRLSAKIYDAISILGVKGIGPAMVDSFVIHGMRTAFDIFSKDFRKSMLDNGLEMNKNISKAYFEIDRVKSIPLWKFLMMLGINGLGKATAIQIANKIAGISYDFSGLEKNIVNNFPYNYDNFFEVCNEAKIVTENGIDIEYPKEDVLDEGLIKAEFTGSPKPFYATKEDFLRDIEENGYRHVKIAKADVLFTDSYDSSSSKMKDAKKRGLKIITYEDYIKNK